MLQWIASGRQYLPLAWVPGVGHQFLGASALCQSPRLLHLLARDSLTRSIVKISPPGLERAWPLSNYYNNYNTWYNKRGGAGDGARARTYYNPCVCM